MVLHFNFSAFDSRLATLEERFELHSDTPGCQQKLIALAENRLRAAMRLRRRKPQIIVRRHRQTG